MARPPKLTFDTLNLQVGQANAALDALANII
ncbi:MAG: hypothetical protein ACI9CE_000191 [Flavobacterium sp.]|jgi:hypothetical protein